jgi:hypothetical protein
MSDLTPAATMWLAAHHGVITTATLRDLAVSKATIKRLVAAGVLRLITRGVYVAASTPRTIEQHCAVLSAIHPTGFVTGPTAGGLAKLRRMPRASALHFSVPHGIHLPRASGVHWRQTTAIIAADRTVRSDGITVAAPARLAFDLAADLRPLDHLSVVNQLLHESTVTVEELQAIERRLGHPARPGSGTFRRTLESLGGAAPSQSHPEVLLAEALRRRGVPVEQQVPVCRPDGRRVHLDLGVAALRWGVELDIHPEHRSVEGHAADAQRRRDLHRVGWQVEVVTEHDMRRPEVVAADLAALYHARRRITDHPSVGGPEIRPPALG